MTSSKQISELKQKTIKSTVQLISREIIMKVIAIIGQLFLVRLLAPSVFGVFAILSFILSVSEIFSDIGFNFTTIQQKKQPSHQQLTTMFFIKLLLSVFIICLLNLLASFLPSLYTQFTQSEVLMFRILTLTLLIKPLQSLIVSLLERDLRYKEISVIDLSGMISYYFVAIIGAMMGLNIWSFIWAIFAKTIIEGIATFIYHPWLPKISFHINDIKNYLSLGKYFQLAVIVGVIHNAIIPVLGGIKLPLNQIGFLDWSFNLASFPRIFIDNLGRVSFSSFSRMQDNKQMIAESSEKAFELLSIVSTFIIVITLAFGYELIHFVVSDKWLPALPALYFYVGSIFFMNGNGLFGHALLAIGKVKSITISSAILTLFEIIIALLLLITFGFTGISISFFIISAITFVVNIWLCYSEKIYIRVRKILVVNTILFSIGFSLAYLLNNSFESTLFSFVIKLFLETLGYLVFVILFSSDSIRTGIKLLRRFKPTY